jgi:2-polyprenyl-6-methoxyphenol hydroxylase-like FAD-dependent oxidoreductase
MRRVLIVGAGQSGLQLGLTLLAEGYTVTLCSARTPDEVRTGRVTSTQAMFAQALDTEAVHGLNLWDDETPPIDGFHITVSAEPGRRAFDVLAPLDSPAQSTDQRVKLAAWLELFEQRGGTVRYGEVTPADLDPLSAAYDLTIVAAGKGDLARTFPRDAARSPYTAPQRGLALAYVHGLEPDPMYPAPNVGLHAVPGLGELVVIPALTLSGPCDILFWEALPGGPLDRWTGPMSPSAHLAQTLALVKEYAPWVADRCGSVELTDARATLAGRFTPTVRHPVAELPSGRPVLGMADAVVANDPITGQGSNAAAKCAAGYLDAVLARGEEPFDRDWMERTFATFWDRHGQPITEWTNAMLAPLPDHVQRILGTAAGSEPVARRFANGFSDPADYRRWLMAPDTTDAYLAEVAARG